MLVRRLHQQLALAFRWPMAAAQTQRQFLLTIQTLCPFVIDQITLLPQLAMQLGKAPGRMRLDQIYQTLLDVIIR